MKTRVSMIANFFAINLLFFALYLNFIHKDNNSVAAVGTTHPAPLKGTVLVKDPQKYLRKYETNKVAVYDAEAKSTSAPVSEL